MKDPDQFLEQLDKTWKALGTTSGANVGEGVGCYMMAKPPVEGKADSDGRAVCGPYRTVGSDEAQWDVTQLYSPDAPSAKEYTLDQPKSEDWDKGRYLSVDGKPAVPGIQLVGAGGKVANMATAVDEPEVKTAEAGAVVWLDEPPTKGLLRPPASASPEATSTETSTSTSTPTPTSTDTPTASASWSSGLPGPGAGPKLEIPEQPALIGTASRLKLGGAFLTDRVGGKDNRVQAPSGHTFVTVAMDLTSAWQQPDPARSEKVKLSLTGGGQTVELNDPKVTQALNTPRDNGLKPLIAAVALPGDGKDATLTLTDMDKAQSYSLSEFKRTNPEIAPSWYDPYPAKLIPGSVAEKVQIGNAASKDSPEAEAMTGPVPTGMRSPFRTAYFEGYGWAKDNHQLIVVPVYLDMGDIRAMGKTTYVGNTIDEPLTYKVNDVQGTFALKDSQGTHPQKAFLPFTDENAVTNKGLINRRAWKTFNAVFEIPYVDLNKDMTSDPTWEISGSWTVSATNTEWPDLGEQKVSVDVPLVFKLGFH